MQLITDQTVAVVLNNDSPGTTNFNKNQIKKSMENFFMSNPRQSI